MDQEASLPVELNQESPEEERGEKRERCTCTFTRSGVSYVRIIETRGENMLSKLLKS